VSRAQVKLNEAAFFLRKLQESVDDREAVGHYLSAFVTAARSVTDLQHAEFAKVPGFKVWDRQRWVNLNADAVVAFLFDRRNDTVHIERKDPSAHVQVEVHEVIHLTDAAIIQVVQEGEVVETRRYENPPEPKQEPNPPRIEWRWYFSDLPDMDLVTACTHLLSLLRDYVDACERKFT